MNELVPQEPKICMCICHTEGMIVLPCMPCCDLTYQKYLDKDGKLNKEKYEKLLKGKTNVQ